MTCVSIIWFVVVCEVIQCIFEITLQRTTVHILFVCLFVCKVYFLIIIIVVVVVVIVVYVLFR